LFAVWNAFCKIHVQTRPIRSIKRTSNAVHRAISREIRVALDAVAQLSRVYKRFEGRGYYTDLGPVDTLRTTE